MYTMWDAIPLVTSGLTLAAFVAAVAAWVYRTAALQKERLIRTAPDAERGRLVASALEFFNVEAANLTKQQQYDLALTQIQARARRFLLTFLLAVLALVLACGVVIASMLIGQTAPDPDNPLTFEILDSSTNDRIHQASMTVRYRAADAAEAKPAAVEQGLCEFPKDVGDAEIVEVEGARGYRFSREKQPPVDHNAPLQRILLDRRTGEDVTADDELFRVAIRPETPYVDRATYNTAIHPPAVRADDVTLVCTNNTNHWVDVFMYRYRYAEPGKREGGNWYDPWLCKPNATSRVFDSFGKNDSGYFFIYGSVFGTEGVLLWEGDLFQCARPEIVLDMDSDGQGRQKLTADVKFK